MRISLGYPEEDDELAIVHDQRHGHPLDRIGPVVTVEDLRSLQLAVEQVYVDELLQRWIVALVRATRGLEIVDLPASVRGTLALERAARALALLEGRDYVEPRDVELLFTPIIAHRVCFSPSFYATARTVGPEEALRRFWQCCLELAPRPR
jgi:MoxR-like ATPase